MGMNDEQVLFNIFKAIEYPEATNDCFVVNHIVQAILEIQERSQFSEPLEHILTSKEIEEEEDEDLVELMLWLYKQSRSSSIRCKQPEPLLSSQIELNMNIPSIINPLELDLKPLPKYLKYAILQQPNALPVIISASITSLQEEKLLRVLRDQHLSIGWTIANIRGIKPKCLHEQNFV